MTDSAHGAPVVVGVDCSDNSRRALEVAADLARALGTPLRVVLAHSYLDQHHPGGSTDFDPAYTDDDARAALDEVIGDVLPGDLDVTVEPVVVCDLPARALLDEAAGARMLVVGARGLGGFRGLLLGSVSQQVVAHSSCPVVVVPQGARGDDR